MSIRSAWSTDETEILDFENVNTDTVRVSRHHIDPFDEIDDRTDVIGEFSIAALRRALLAPVPAAAHVANKGAKPAPVRKQWLKRRKTA